MVDPGTGRREDQESPAGREQARLQQAQRMESLGKLAGGIAHDFNNLLAVILSYASFVSAELAVPSGPDWPERLESARRDLGQITLAAERAASLTRQLLASVHAEVVRPQVLDVDPGGTDVQEMLRRTLGEHVGLVAALADGLWPVLADPDQQALLGAIMAGAGGSVPKQTREVDLVSAARTVDRGQSVLDPYASRQVLTRLRDRMASEDPMAALTARSRSGCSSRKRPRRIMCPPCSPSLACTAARRLLPSPSGTLRTTMTERSRAAARHLRHRFPR
jgi:signal transduction histidine kinase